MTETVPTSGYSRTTVSGTDGSWFPPMLKHSNLTWTHWLTGRTDGRCTSTSANAQADNRTQCQCSIAGARLTIARHHPYLGVELCDTLRWNAHVTKVASKANHMLGFIRRNLHSCSETVRQSAYFTLVRPQLEYVGSTWDPFTQKNIAELEKVQRRSARFVKNDYRWDSSPTAMMKWDSRAERREARRLVMFYKSVQGETAQHEGILRDSPR